MNDQYQYYELPLTPSMASKIALKNFAGQTLERKNIVDGVIKYHLSMGGYPSQAQDLSRSIKSSLEDLRENGHITNPSKGFWRFPIETNEESKTEESSIDEVFVYQQQPEQPKILADKIIGDGNGSVYIYYYDTYKKYADLVENEFWPCKIGLSERDPIIRVLSQSGTALPELPKIAVLINTNDPSVLEKTIHSILYLKNRKVELSPGNEWFYTNPEEIEEILKFCEIIP